jgi:hypothetical protein
MAADPNVVIWGSYPVSDHHLMGEPTLVTASIGYPLPESSTIWPGVQNRKVAYTGRPLLVCWAGLYNAMRC